jgi:hypothetical protein
MIADSISLTVTLRSDILCVAKLAELLGDVEKY